MIGLVLAQLTRRSSLRWSFVIVALSAVVGVIAGIVGTARAMFFSQHDFEVMLWVVGAAGVVSLGFALPSRDGGARLAGGRGGHPCAGGARIVRGTRGHVFRALRGSRPSWPRPRRSSRRPTNASGPWRRSRRELVAWVSHDLRTPLAGLRAMAEALEDGIAEDPQRYHQQMRETVDRMARMVDDLFELSRIHSGALQLSLEVVPVEDAISEALAVSGPVAQAKSVRLDGFAEPGVAVRADPRELARMIGNLVTNAIRHTPSEGLVEVSARASDSGVQFSVVDRCGGIPEADLDRVFDVAWRGSHARTPEAAAGSGLGLAIVRGIAEAHRGTVRVDNVGEGCRFLVELPAHAS